MVSVWVFRAFHVCSSFVNFHKEIVRIQQILLDNRFPLTLIHKLIRNFLDQQYFRRVKARRKEGEKPSIIFCLPYLGHLSFRIRKNMNRLFRTHYPNIKIRMIFRSAKRMSLLFQHKDRFPSLVCSNVVCKFSCSGCNSAYYGKTTRNFLVRCNEHLGVNKSGYKLAAPSPSSIRDHVKQTGHIASIDDFCIISKMDNSYDLLIHESLLIQKDRPILNSQQFSISMVLFLLCFFCLVCSLACSPLTRNFFYLPFSYIYLSYASPF